MALAPAARKTLSGRGSGRETRRMGSRGGGEEWGRSEGRERPIGDVVMIAGKTESKVEV